MRKILFFFYLLPFMGWSQQRPHYTQYILNNYIVNPAITGIENYVDIKMSARNQWTGIDGAPRTFYLTIHGALNKPDHRLTATSFPIKGENPRGKEYWTYYNAAIPHHGLGFTAVNYTTGYINRLTTYATYAYHVGLSTNTSLSAGFGAGISQFSINRSKISLAEDFDPIINTTAGQLKQFKPEVNAGLWLYAADYFVGVSAQQILPTQLQLIDNQANQSTQVPHIFATAGYKLFMNDDWSLTPSIMTRYISGLPLALDVNFKTQYLDQFWIGGSYRKGDGISGMFGININQTMNISYAYDLSINNNLLRTVHKGTHELMIGFLLNNIYGDWSPRNVW